MLTNYLRHLKAKQLASEAIDKQTQVANDYEQHMEKLYQALEDLESSEPVANSHASAEAIKGQKSRVLATLKLLDHAFSRPHESFSNDLDFIQQLIQQTRRIKIHRTFQVHAFSNRYIV